MYDLARVSSHQWAISLARARRSSASWPSPLNHSRRSGSFITVTIISISLTHKSCHKSSGISFCDNMHDQCTVGWWWWWGGGVFLDQSSSKRAQRPDACQRGFYESAEQGWGWGGLRCWMWTLRSPSQMSSPVAGPCVAAIRLLLSACTTKHHPHCAGSCSTWIMQPQRLTI